MFEKLKEMNAELDQLKAKHLEISKTMFSDVSKQLFEKHSVLESFGWKQYTPYFNDGDECTFSAHVEEPDINGYDSYDDEIYEKLLDYEGKPRSNFDPALQSAVDDVQGFLSNIDEQVLRNMFGDHVKITVSRDGVKVADYRHD